MVNLTHDAIYCRDLVILLIILIEIHLCNIFYVQSYCWLENRNT
jgi:hypothetical protein